MQSAHVSPSGVRSPVDKTESVTCLYNKAIMLLADDDAIYVLPIDESEETETV